MFFLAEVFITYLSRSVVIDSTFWSLRIGIAEHFKRGGVMIISRMMLFIFLKGVKLLSEVTNLGQVTLGFCSFNFRLILLDVFVDGFHGIRGLASPSPTHTPYGW